LNSAVTNKIQGFDTFAKCKSLGDGYRVIEGSPLKLSSRTRLCRVYMFS